MVAAGRDHINAIYVVAMAEHEKTVTLHGNVDVSGERRLSCYLSPFDALLDVMRCERGSIQVLQVTDLTPDALTGRASERASIFLHAAWRARDGRILVRPDGAPDTVAFGIPRPQSWDEMAAPFEATVRLMDAVHEQAGLFAWREPLQAFFTSDANALQAMAQRAWREVPVMQVDHADPDFDQFAVFDPEFQQWHFVPVLEVFDAMQV